MRGMFQSFTNFTRKRLSYDDRTTPPLCSRLALETHDGRASTSPPEAKLAQFLLAARPCKAKIDASRAAIFHNLKYFPRAVLPFEGSTMKKLRHRDRGNSALRDKCRACTGRLPHATCQPPLPPCRNGLGDALYDGAERGECVWRSSGYGAH